MLEVSLHFIILFVIFVILMFFADLSGLTLSSSGRKLLLFFFPLLQMYKFNRVIIYLLSTFRPPACKG